MANAALRNVKVLPNSANMEEARHRVFEFFRTACRLLPSVMEIYNLYDVVSVSELRSSVASQIRNNIHVTDPKVFSIFYLFYFGLERFLNLMRSKAVFGNFYFTYSFAAALVLEDSRFDSIQSSFEMHSGKLWLLSFSRCN